MQNKGAIKIFALLLALCCVFYLSFTWVVYNAEQDAKNYADAKVSLPYYQNEIKLRAGDKSDVVSKVTQILKDSFLNHCLDTISDAKIYSF